LTIPERLFRQAGAAFAAFSALGFSLYLDIILAILPEKGNMKGAY